MNLLPDAPRILIRADLAPLQGTRFQPTGFPDIGAATYDLADGTSMLLVESEQSVANRLESVCWNDETGTVVESLKDMPFVQVDDKEGQPLTASILEAHRLNSVYIEKSDFFEKTLKKAIGHDKKKPTDLRKLAAALCHFDPNSLVHGTFLESIAGTLRLPRMLGGFIEASDVSVVAAGGVKNDRVTPETKGSDRKAAQGYGNVPYHRDEYTADSITAFFKLDLSLLRSFGLSEHVNRFLVALALWKVQKFLATGLRLRTACDFDATEVKVTRPDEWTIPTSAELEEALPQLIAVIRSEEPDTFGPAPTRAIYNGK